MKLIAVIAIVAVVIFFVFFREGEIKREDGILVLEDPYQNNLSTHESFTEGDYTITKMAEFKIRARVLSKKHYRSGQGSDIGKYDLALGWGPMSDSSVLRHLKISQRNRWYYWKTKNFPIPRREIETHSANMHLLTVDPFIVREIGKVKRGNIVEIKGHLVSVSSTGGWNVKSSMTRTDTGGGSCEVIWVDEFEIIE